MKYFNPCVGQNLQIIECHPRSVGPPSCQEHRPDQNLRFAISLLHYLKAHSKTAVNSRGLKTQPCRTPPVMEKLRFLPHFPMTSPSCSSYAFSNNHTKCSGTPCSRRASHNVDPCTRSNAFDKSTLTIHTVIPAAAALSSRRFAVNKCSSNLLPGRKPCCSCGCFASKFPPHGQGSGTQIPCRKACCLQ